MKIFQILLSLLFISFFPVNAQKIVFTPQWTPQSQFAGYYAALENGYYAELGLDVEIVHPSTSYSSMSMLEEGTTDITTCELIQALFAADRGVRLVNLLQTTQHSTLVLVSRIKDVNDMSDLAGRRIGTWKVGFSEIPHMIDEEQNLGIEWIKFINPLNLYISGAIDATLGKNYNELVLFSMSGITPGSVLKFSELGFDFPEDGLYVHEEYYKKNPLQCRLFAKASRKGWEWVRNNKEKALEIVMKYVKAGNVPTNIYNQRVMLDTILEAQEDVKGCTPSYKLKVEDFNRLNEILKRFRYTSVPVEYERFIGE